MLILNFTSYTYCICSFLYETYVMIVMVWCFSSQIIVFSQSYWTHSFITTELLPDILPIKIFIAVNYRDT